MDDKSLLDLLFITENYCRRKVSQFDQEIAHTKELSVKKIRIRQDYLNLLDAIESVRGHYENINTNSFFLDDYDDVYRNC